MGACIFAIQKQVSDIRSKISEVDQSLKSYIIHNRKDISNWVNAMKKLTEDGKEFDRRIDYFFKQYIKNGKNDL